MALSKERVQLLSDFVVERFHWEVKNCASQIFLGFQAVVLERLLQVSFLSIVVGEEPTLLLQPVVDQHV